MYISFSILSLSWTKTFIFKMDNFLQYLFWDKRNKLTHIIRDSDLCVILGWKLLTHAINAPESHSAVLHARQRHLQLIMQLSVLYLKPCGPQELPSYASWPYEYYHSGDSDISLTWKTFWKRYENNAVHNLENLKVSNGKSVMVDVDINLLVSKICCSNSDFTLNVVCPIVKSDIWRP